MEQARLLQSNEIECRVGQTYPDNKAVTILLYKNARVDMCLLDERFGAENWECDYKELKGNLYCGVGVNYGQGLVWKWDCGTESNTEKEKGEASDAFKRACVKHGQGRELYSAPKIYIRLTEKEWNNGRPRISLTVAKIGYTANREIKDLVIIDRNLNERYRMENGVEKRIAQAEQAPAAPQANTNALNF